MDLLIAEASNNFEAFRLNHLNAEPVQSPFSLNYNSSKWDWSQLYAFNSFSWKTGVSPLADLRVIQYSWLAYFVTIISLKVLMANQAPMKLRGVTAIHNLILCIGSLGMFLAGLVGSIQVYQERGMSEVFWATEEKNRQGLQYWALYIFYLSKFYELLDTVILVLKKKPVIFLHWYHHSIVILMVWGWCEAKIGFGTMGLLMNTCVHVFMYWYYFASNLGWNVWFKKYITTLQIIQFIGSFMMTIPFIQYAIAAGNYKSWIVIQGSTMVNFSFLCLFIQFYLKSYYGNSAKKSVQPSQKSRIERLQSLKNKQ